MSKLYCKRDICLSIVLSMSNIENKNKYAYIVWFIDQVDSMFSFLSIINFIIRAYFDSVSNKNISDWFKL